MVSTAIAGPRHRRVRLAARLALAALLVAGLGFAAAWALTPGVGSAQARIRAELRAVGTSDVQPATPPRVAAALIATEDSRFYSNPGIDVLALPRDAAGALGIGSEQGGATLEQQLAKMVFTPGRTGVAVEIEQAVLAVKLDAHFSKAEILRMYLAIAYFGHGFYGVSAASQGYFGLPAARLGWGQASLLVGLLQAPTAYDPLAHLAVARLRERHVLDRLVATGKLSSGQADAAFTAPLGLV